MKNAIATADFVFRFWWCYAPHSSAPHGLRRWNLVSAPCVCGCFNFSISAAAAPLRRQLAVSLQRLAYSRPDFSPRFRSDLTSAAAAGAGKNWQILACELYKIILLYNSERTGQFLGQLAKTGSDKKPHANFFEGNILEQVCGIIVV